MPYIGKQPIVGNFQVCDAISVVNGQAAYTMQVNSTNVTPETAFHMLVSLNGVLQKPGSSFTISGSTITFASNLATGDVIDFIILLGDVLNIGAPSDDTVTASKLNNNMISGLTALTATPADTDEFLISDAGTIKRIDYSLVKGGGVLQVKSTTKTGTQTIASSSFTAISSFTVSVTPSSSSNKILLFGSVSFGGQNNMYGMGALYRQIASGGYSVVTAATGDADSNATRCTIPLQTLSAGDSAWKTQSSSFNFLDAPSTTSQVDYQIHCRTSSATDLLINEESNTSDGDYDARPITTITALEIDSGVL